MLKNLTDFSALLSTFNFDVICEYLPYGGTNILGPAISTINIISNVREQLI